MSRTTFAGACVASSEARISPVEGNTGDTLVRVVHRGTWHEYRIDSDELDAFRAWARATFVDVEGEPDDELHITQWEVR